MYKPGQKGKLFPLTNLILSWSNVSLVQVQFRILSTDHQLKPVDKLYQEVFIQDASNTRVFQWLNVKNETGWN